MDSKESAYYCQLLRVAFPAGWFPKMPLCTSLPPYLFSREHPAGHSQPGLTRLSVSDNARTSSPTRVGLTSSTLTAVLAAAQE